MEYLIKKLPSRALAISIFTSLEKHVCSEQFIRQLSAHKMVEQYSWVCFHWWVVKQKLAGRMGTQGRVPLLMGANLRYCLQEYTRDHAYEYQQFFSLDVYAELKRRSGTLLWSLDDYYRFNLKHKGLNQIISQDILCISHEQQQELNNQQDKINKMQQYINNNLALMTKTDSNSIIKNRSMSWKYLSEFPVGSKTTKQTGRQKQIKASP